MADDVVERPRIDSFVAADWAEAINGKLYLMGGGFDTLYAANFPTTFRFAIGAVLRIPWHDTNRRLPLAGHAETADGGDELGWKLEGEFEAGRPAGRRGGDVMAVIATPVQFDIAEPTELVMILRFGDDERRLGIHATRHPFVPNVPSPDG